jgi:rhodanese-related sulfurtransferase
MPFRRISPAEAKALMDEQGYVYVDVRSIPEFEAGHPVGAVNVPLLHAGPMGMTPNPEFLAVMEEAFPKDSKLVLGCKSGGRSLRACSLLESAGFTNLVDQRAGYDGAPDPSGRVEPGWRPAGLPTTRDAPADHTYDGIKAKLGR